MAKCLPKILILIIVASLASCSPVSLMYHQIDSSSDHELSLSSVEVEMQLYPTESNFRVPFSVGYSVLRAGSGWIPITNTQWNAKISDGLTFAFNPMYNFTKGRVQPYAGLRLSGTFLFDTDIEDMYGSGSDDSKASVWSLTPNVGLRVYVTKKVAVNIGGGYHISWLSFKEKVDYFEKSFNGLAISFGFSYAF